MSAPLDEAMEFEAMADTRFVHGLAIRIRATSPWPLLGARQPTALVERERAIVRIGRELQTQ